MNIFLIHVFIYAFLITIVNAQFSTVPANQPNGNGNGTSLPSSPGTSPQTSNTTNPACVNGVNGQMLIFQPNMSSLVTVGTAYNVSWSWSILVTKPPSFVDVYIQLIAPGVRETWKQKIAEKQSVDPRWFWWTPEGLVDGVYKMRLVPDGKETFGVNAKNLPCFANGESVPSASAEFTISNPRGELNNYPDKFPPNSAGTALEPENTEFIYVFCSLVGILIGSLGN